MPLPPRFPSSAARTTEPGTLTGSAKGLRQGVTAAVGYGIFAGLVLIFAGRPLSLIFVSKDAVGVLAASTKYLRCMGYFYWCLGILYVTGW